MEGPSHDLSQVAHEVFDRYGRLKQEFKTHAVLKGSGCWGEELDLGSLFVVEYVEIEKSWRRKGIGKEIITSLIRKANAGGRTPAFNLVLPGYLDGDVEKDTITMKHSERRAFISGVLDGVRSFYRSLGFRRHRCVSLFWTRHRSYTQGT
jgi:GNAT superfamily N-acetyltransferase